MKLYSAELYAINHNIPYSDRCNWVVETGERIEYSKGKYILDNVQFRTIFINKGTLVVRKRFFGQLEDIATGKKFPEMMLLQDRTITYHFTRMNKRLYVKLLAEMSEQDMKRYYESLTKRSIKMRQEQLSKIIEEEQMYWNPIPKKVSTRQYVKMIEQMRNDD